MDKTSLILVILLFVLLQGNNAFNNWLQQRGTREVAIALERELQLRGKFDEVVLDTNCSYDPQQLNRLFRR